MKALLLSSISALLVQPLVFFCWFVLPGLLEGASLAPFDLVPMSVAVIVLAAFPLIVLGLPIYYCLWYTGRTTWPFVLIGGFVAGTGLLALGSVSSWLSHIDNWPRQLEELAIAGAHGVTGAAAFHLAWRKLRPNNSFKPKPLRGSA